MLVLATREAPLEADLHVGIEETMGRKRKGNGRD